MESRTYKNTMLCKPLAVCLPNRAITIGPGGTGMARFHHVFRGAGDRTATLDSTAPEPTEIA